jgi:hypothetical protein
MKLEIRKSSLVDDGRYYESETCIEELYKN